MKIIVASANPVKLAVAKNAFTALFPDQELDIIPTQSQSGVPGQPMDDQTQQGAMNRLLDVRARFPDADYWISQEGGLFHDQDGLYNRSWIMVCDADGFVGKSSTTNFRVPNQVAEYVLAGDELGTATDKMFNLENSKQKGGIISVLTGGVIDRTNYYTQAAIVALAQVVHKDWY